MNNSASWAPTSRCYEQLKAMDNFNDSRSWAQGFRCYEQCKVVVDIYETKILILVKIITKIVKL